MSNEIETLTDLTVRLREAIRCCSLPPAQVSEITGYSQRQILALRSKGTLNSSKVLSVLAVLGDGEITSYGEIGKALGSPTAAQAVTKIIKSADVPGPLAARVVQLRHRQGSNYRMIDSEFDSHHDYKFRSQALAETKVPFELDADGGVLVPMRLLVDGDTLRQRMP